LIPLLEPILSYDWVSLELLEELKRHDPGLRERLRAATAGVRFSMPSMPPM
jgi:hypothetical protein